MRPHEQNKAQYFLMHLSILRISCGENEYSLCHVYLVRAFYI